MYIKETNQYENILNDCLSYTDNIELLLNEQLNILSKFLSNVNSILGGISND